MWGKGPGLTVGNSLSTDFFIGGWSALAVWQYLRCANRPRLDRPYTVPHLLARAGIKAKSRVSFPGAPNCRSPWEVVLREVGRIRETLRSAYLELTGAPSAPVGIVGGASAILPTERPIDLLVDDPAHRRNSAAFFCRVWGRNLPPASFFPLGPHVYLSRPEFVFLQLATELDWVDLALLGCEMLGFYACNHVGSSDLLRCHPLATVGSLTRFLEGIPAGVRGIARATRVAGLVVERSASTGETAMALLLSIPRSRGGYGLPVPTMNARVDVPARLCELLGRNHLMCDAFWPKARFALEYNGKAEHEGDVAAAHDRERAGRLQAIGVKMETVTAFELVRTAAFDKVARRVARSIGYRLFSRDYGNEWHKRRHELRGKVIGSLFDGLRSPTEDELRLQQPYPRT